MGALRGLATSRVDGVPYTISEYNHPFPNQYGAEAQPILRAYGRLQGWDGVFQYTYAHRADVEPEMNTYFFSMAARTDVLAHMPACRSEEHTSELQSLMRISYAVFCLKKKKTITHNKN